MVRRCPYLWPERTYLFKELYIETITRNPKKVGLSGVGIEGILEGSWGV